VPLTAVAFASVIAGMIVMLIAGVRSDLKVRKVLRARLAEEDREERERFADTTQQDLFPPDHESHGEPPRLTH
jgi:heme exporter protein D